MENFGPKTTATEAAQIYSKQIKGKIILVTGVSPASLGSTLLTILYHHSPAHIVLLSRTTSKVQEVVNTLPDNPSTHISIVQVDLSSQTSVRKAAQKVISLLREKNGNAGIDIIFNNAGINISSRLVTPEGIELQFATNHLGPFLLTNLLLPTLLSSKFKNQRVVNTSSEAHRISPIRFTDYNLLPTFPASSLPEDEKPRRGLPPGFLRNDGGYESSIAYGQSKTANVLFSVALNGRGVRSLAVMPGNIATNLTRGLDTKSLEGLRSIHDWKNLDEGVATLIVAAFAPNLNQSSDIYLEDCKPKRPSKWAADKEKAKRLWRLSEELVGEKFDFNGFTVNSEREKSRL